MIKPAAIAGRRVVVVGGGPGGLEAARVTAERGHEIVLFEAASRPGGQLVIASRTSLRRDLIGIVDWRWAEIERLGVDLRLDTYADADAVLAEAPDAVIVATGRLPDVEWLDGGEHCTTVWDALSRTGPAPGGDVIIYDGTGRHEAVSCALHLAEAGRAVSLVTIESMLAAEMAYTDRAIYSKRFAQRGIPVLGDRVLIRVRRDGNRLTATFRHELTGEESELRASEIVIEHGTYPLCEVFDGLRDRAANRGVTDIDRLLAGRPQIDERPANGAFELHRIGDAVASRNVHAAIYDALRLCMAL